MEQYHKNTALGDIRFGKPSQNGKSGCWPLNTSVHQVYPLVVASHTVNNLKSPLSVVTGVWFLNIIRGSLHLKFEPKQSKQLVPGVSKTIWPPFSRKLVCMHPKISTAYLQWLEPCHHSVFSLNTSHPRLLGAGSEPAVKGSHRSAPERASDNRMIW